METVKVKAWAAEQGDFVLINKDYFDPEKHELFEDVDKTPAGKPKKTAKDGADQ